MSQSAGDNEESGITEELSIYRRYLPHWEAGGSIYFLTFRIHGTYPRLAQDSSGVGMSRPPGRLHAVRNAPLLGARLPAFAPQERDIIMRTILFWHEKRWYVHALTVMPDHVHILAQPMEKSPGVWYPLRGLMHSVKRTTAWEINRLRGRTGTLWQSERKDRALRNEFEFYQKATYVLENAQRRGLVEHGWEYEWFWGPGKEALRRSVGRG